MSEPCTQYRWRVWRAYEVRPGDCGPSQVSDGFVKALRRTCKRDGVLDADDYDRWINVAYDYQWGRA